MESALNVGAMQQQQQVSERAALACIRDDFRGKADFYEYLTETGKSITPDDDT
jgi:hypothetical protein